MIKISHVLIVLVGVSASAPAFAHSKTGIVDLNRALKDCNSDQAAVKRLEDALMKLRADALQMTMDAQKAIEETRQRLTTRAREVPLSEAAGM